jgi:hypothetical protein
MGAGPTSEESKAPLSQAGSLLLRANSGCDASLTTGPPTQHLTRPLEPAPMDELGQVALASFGQRPKRPSRHRPFRAVA